LYTGLGVGELIWDRGEDYWQPRLKVWHSQFIYWRWDTRSYWIITEKEPVELTPGDGHWVLFAPFGMHYAHLHGLVRPLMQPWQIRQDAYRDWARYSEVHGLPLVKAKIPANANAQDKREFVSDISGRGNEAVIALPQRDGAGQASFDIDLMEAKAESHKAFDLLIARTETSMAVTVLGQNLSTEVKGGSFAAAKVHDSVRHDLLDADAKALERCIRAQVLRPWAEYNFGDAALAPIPKITTEPVTDRGTTAKAFSDLATSLYSFAQAGAPVDQRAVLEEFGIPTTIETPAPLSGPESGGSKPAEEDSEQKETPAAEPPAKTRARSTEAVVH
jgi:phage gp29-like protein